MMKKQPSLFKAVMPLAFLSTVMVVVLPNLAQADYEKSKAAHTLGDYKPAMNECLPDAERGEPKCQNLVGVMYGYGLGVPKNNVKAVMWYKRAAAQGNMKGQFNLGRMYSYGDGVPEDDAEAVKWFRLAAEQGLAIAQFDLGYMYDKGLGVEKNDAKAAYWYHLAAAQGHEMAKQWVNKQTLPKQHETTHADGRYCDGGWEGNCFVVDNGPIEVDHPVSWASSAIALDKDISDWDTITDQHFLTDQNGERAGISFRLTHSVDGEKLFLLISSDERPKRIDVFLDTSGDTILDRPAQYTFQNELSTAQSSHAQAVEAMIASDEASFAQEWSFDLSLLGVEIEEGEPAHIGFDIEVVSGDDKVFRWGDKGNKWLVDRRLTRVSLVPGNIGFGLVSGAVNWTSEAKLSPPQRVGFRRVGNDHYYRIIETNSVTGAYSATLPEGDYDIAAIDSRTAPTLADHQRVSVSRNDEVTMPSVTLDRPVQSDLDSLIANVMEHESINTLGVVYIREGGVELSKAFGVRADGSQADSANSIFKMASVSKPVAALVVLTLVEKGLWSLDEPLSNYWVDPGIVDDPRNKLITTRMVLGHLSGLPNQAGDGPLAFLYSPEEQQSYSGEGYKYLRRAVEVKLGAPFQEIAKTHLFEPAGMLCSSFQGPIEECGQYVQKFHNTFRFDPPSWGEADVKGGLMMNVQDMQSLLEWILAGANLSSDTWAAISTPNAESLLLDDENSSKDRFGLGWVVSYQDGLVLAHGGSEFGARTYIVVLPDQNSGIIIATNASGGLPAIRMIVEATLKQLHPLRELDQSLIHSESFDW